jgi:glycosyltransferase involved in cell wall biosynthesis
LKLARGEKIMIYLGRLHPKKGLDLILHAVQKINEPHLTLVMAGDGEPSFVAALEESIRILSLAGKIHRLGFVAGAEKNLLLQGADIFIFPSHHENFGYAVLEALAAGTPVLISNRVALARDVQKQNLGTVMDLDATSIAQAIRLLLKQSQPERSSKIRSFVAENYSWKQCSGFLAALYHSILTERAAAQERSWRVAPSKI